METIRRMVRRIVKPCSRPYQAGAALIDLAAITYKEDIRTWFALRHARSQAPEASPPILLPLRSLMHPILIRPGTEDAATVISNVIREEYGQFQPVGKPQWMIDAGAYIGDTSAYFLSRFQELRVVALEPNPVSYNMVRENMKSYGDRAIVLDEALWCRDERCHFGGDTTVASIRGDGFDVNGVSIETLLDRFSIPYVDILKMDIEGAEQAVFSADARSWLDRVGLIIIEIHGSRILSEISAILSEKGFSMRQFRSVWYCVRSH